MLRRNKTLASLAIAVCSAALPAVAAAHGPPKIDAGPSGSTQATTALFKFSYAEPAPNQRFECSLDGKDFTPCEDSTMPDGLQNYSGLSVGSHTFKVRRAGSPIPSDPLQDTTPAERSWTVTAPPEPTPTPTGTPDPGASPTPTPTPDPGPPPPALDASKPSPCGGVFQITDVESDGHHLNQDYLGAFFKYAGSTLTANLVVKNLTRTVNHEEHDRTFWRLTFATSDGKTRYVTATVNRAQNNAVSFEHGTVNGSTYQSAGATPGKLFEGSNGVIQIVIPELGPGATLRSPVAVAGELPIAGSKPYWTDRAPGGTNPDDPKDTATGADYVVSECGGTASQSGAGGAPGSPGAPASGVQGVTLTKALMNLRYGRLFRLSGRIAPKTSGVRVELLDAKGKVVSRQFTRSGGTFSFKRRARESTQWRVRAAGVSSQSFELTVTPRIRLRAKRVRGGAVRFTGTVKPQRSGTVYLQQRQGGQWVEVGEAKIRRHRFGARIKGLGRGKFRATLG